MGVFRCAFLDALIKKPAVRTLWGGFTTSEQAHGIRLSDLSQHEALNAWQRLTAIVPGAIKDECPLVPLTGAKTDLGIKLLTTTKCKDILFRILEVVIAGEIQVRCDFITAVMSVHPDPFQGYSRAAMIEECIRGVCMERPGVSASA